jgi:hypothetical protein
MLSFIDTGLSLQKLRDLFIYIKIYILDFNFIIYFQKKIIKIYILYNLLLFIETVKLN